MSVTDSVQWLKSGPIDRTPGLPGSDKNGDAAQQSAHNRDGDEKADEDHDDGDEKADDEDCMLVVVTVLSLFQDGAHVSPS